MNNKLISLFIVLLAISSCIEVTARFANAKRSNWKDLGKTEDDFYHTITLALTQRNLAQLEDTVWQVSVPTSPSYGKYLSFEEVVELTAPLPSTIQIVKNWLTNKGVEEWQIKLSESKDFMIVKSPSAILSSLLSTTFHHYGHKHSDWVVVRSVEEYVAVPKAIRPYVDFIGGVTKFPTAKTAFNTEELVQNNEDTVRYLQVFSGDQYFTAIVEYDDTTSPLNFAVTDKLTSATYSYSVPISSCQSSTREDLPATVQYKLSKISAAKKVCVTNMLGPLPNFHPLSVTVSIDGQGSSTETVFLSKFITPSVITDFYRVPSDMLVSAVSTNSQSVAEFLKQYYSSKDLNDFFAAMDVIPTEVTVVGPNDQSNPGGEASLDIQYMMGVAQNVSTVFWSTAGLHDGQEPFLTWITDVLNTANAPLVHSTSYSDDEPSLDVTYMTRVNTEFQKAAARGLSLFYSSGDNGVNGQDASDKSMFCDNAKQFIPAFPSSSPFVTVVGATQFSTEVHPVCSMKTITNTPITCDTVGEVVCQTNTGSLITSGGGFSALFEMPFYQKDAVHHYVSKIRSSIPTSYFNASGRAYPDIAAFGHNYLVFVNGKIETVDGTSASTPVIAALVTMLNEKRLAAGKPPMGFINPFLYLLGDSFLQYFNDITIGNNACNEVGFCCQYSFSAHVGWDATTGWGSPKMDSIAAIAMQV